MAKKARCEVCNRNFKNEEGLADHNLAKHPKFEKKHSKRNYKRIINWAIFIIILGLVGFWIFTSINKSIEANAKLDFKAPQGPIHWHPHLTIIINGITQIIPGGIGLGSGEHSPIHTHESGGMLHMEENNPTKRSVTLGYFFNIWNKKFNEECIFNYCTNKGQLKMYVNGKENFKFQNYFMHDGDNITIDYVSNSKIS